MRKVIAQLSDNSLVNVEIEFHASVNEMTKRVRDEVKKKKIRRKVVKWDWEEDWGG